MTRAQTFNVAPAHKVVFDNGLTLLVREDHSAPVVSAQAWSGPATSPKANGRAPASPTFSSICCSKARPRVACRKSPMKSSVTAVR